MEKSNIQWKMSLQQMVLGKLDSDMQTNGPEGHLGGSVSLASDLGSGHVLMVRGLSPVSGSVLTAQSLEPASDSVSPCPSAPPLLTLCLSCLSKMNKVIQNFFKVSAFRLYREPDILPLYNVSLGFKFTNAPISTWS